MSSDVAGSHWMQPGGGLGGWGEWPESVRVVPQGGRWKVKPCHSFLPTSNPLNPPEHLPAISLDLWT